MSSPATARAPLPADLASHPRLSQWVHVESSGNIQVFAGKVELGQGVSTMLLQVAADELDADPAAISLCVGDTRSCPDQGITAGSLSTEVGAMALRQACAEVRYLFVAAAAARLGVPAAEMGVQAGRFRAVGPAGAAGTSLGYGDLAAAVDLNQPARGEARPKAPALRRWAGTGLPRPDLQRKLFGAGFIHDIEWPGMLHGRVVHPPTLTSRWSGIDAAVLQAVQARPGVVLVYQDGSFIAVAAEREEQAVAAAAALQRAVQWQAGAALPRADGEQRWLRLAPSVHSVVDETPPAGGTRLESNVATAGATAPAADRDTPAGTAAVARHFEADYSRPFLAHASIGPSCALARWEGGELTVCTHAQGSFNLRLELSRLFEISAEHVHVQHADGAGCYGHNGADDAAIEAALLARAAGRPVRLQWSREDELAWSPFGSAMSVHISAGLDAQGRILHWQHTVWSHTHVQRPGLLPGLNSLAARLRNPPAPPPPLRDFPLPAGGGQRNALPLYALPTRRIHYHLVEPVGLRTSALRALGAFANVFAIECAMDELAAAAGQDPLAFRLAHLHDNRAAAVLQAAAHMAGWAQPKPAAQRAGAARGRGLALARYKNSGAWCAVVVEVEVTDRVLLDSAWVAVDAGEVVHHDGLVNQIEGGVLQAASWTLKEAVPWDTSGVQLRGWDDYPIAGFDEVPATLQVRCIDAPSQPPLGVGECAAGPTAAALANAVADALGVRARHLPLTPQRLLAALEGG